MTLIYFIFVLGITVLIHELGHFIFAKKAGIYIYEFSLGMGPKLFSWHRKNDETMYAIRLFPIGGYVSMAGESVEYDEEIPKEKHLQEKTWMQRFLTIIAGVAFNFLLALILLFIVGLIEGSPSKETYIEEIDKKYNSSKTNMQKGDEITHINHKKVSSSDMLLLYLQIENGKTITFTVKHQNEKTEDVIVAPTKVKENGKTTYKYGFSLKNKIRKGIIPAFTYAFEKCISLLNQMIHIIFYLCTGKLGIGNLSGPIGIFAIVGQSAAAGFINIIYLIAYLCINVGFINLLPIPAFDGGRIFFMIIEKIRGKKVNEKTENLIHGIGMAVLMILMIFITCQDIVRLFL